MKPRAFQTAKEPVVPTADLPKGEKQIGSNHILEGQKKFFHQFYKVEIINFLNNMNKKIIILVVVIVVLLVGAVGYLTVVKKPISNNLQESKDIIQCGSVSQKILTQYDYQPTETEKEAVIKSLACINQALIKCSPSLLVINNANQTMNIAVKGQGKLGCNVSVQKFTGETMTCPLPSDYVVDVQKKFAVSNFDATIVTDLITNINAEISNGNKSGNCTVTK